LGSITGKKGGGTAAQTYQPGKSLKSSCSRAILPRHELRLGHREKKPPHSPTTGELVVSQWRRKGGKIGSTCREFGEGSGGNVLRDDYDCAHTGKTSPKAKRDKTTCDRLSKKERGK